MSTYPPPANLIQSLNAMATIMNSMNTGNQQFQMPPMGGMITMGVGIPPMANLPQVTQQPQMAPSGSGTSVASGATISAPPVRNVPPQEASATTNATSSVATIAVPPIAPHVVPPSLLGTYPGYGPPPRHPFHPPPFPGQGHMNYRPRKPHVGGPTVTVFVGNITERASDMLIRQLLSKCGTVSNWKRVQGTHGKLQAFGFCDYCDPESAMRALRLLQDFEIADKKLLVKVDAKTKEKLDEYKASKAAQAGKSDTSNANSAGDDEIDEATKQEDAAVVTQLQGVLKEHEIELSKDPDPKERTRKFYNERREQKPENLNEIEMEDDKRSLIHREIDKFRDTYKVRIFLTANFSLCG